MMQRAAGTAITATDPDITGLSADSREVQAGYLFAALPGTRHDGRSFIADAVQRGARVILTPPDTALPTASPDVIQLEDANPRRRLALMAAQFYAAQPATIAAVTGTNGKTSVASFTRQIWQTLGHQAASMGTLGLTTPDSSQAGALTTPDPIALHRDLAALAADGIDHLVFEASSHGLAQYRLDGVRVTAAAFTNLTRDHLDYHDTMSAYLAAKLRLFDQIMEPGGVAVLNTDVPHYRLVRNACEARGHSVIACGRAGEADLQIRDVTPRPDGLRLSIRVYGKPCADLELPLVGAFQAENVVLATGLAIATGAAPRKAIKAAKTVTGVRGRMERVTQTANGAAVYVDYAHTPDALANALRALRPHVTGRMLVVFGCGGDRDQGKRPQMGKVAAELADRAIVTDDNPRSEDPALVRSHIMPACPGALEVAGRAEAIATAMAELHPDDVLLIAGKGHETGQIVGDQVLPFDDAAVARAVAGGSAEPAEPKVSSA